MKRLKLYELDHLYKSEEIKLDKNLDFSEFVGTINRVYVSSRDTYNFVDTKSRLAFGADGVEVTFDGIIEKCFSRNSGGTNC